MNMCEKVHDAHEMNNENCDRPIDFTNGQSTLQITTESCPSECCGDNLSECYHHYYQA